MARSRERGAGAALATLALMLAGAACHGPTKTETPGPTPAPAARDSIVLADSMARRPLTPPMLDRSTPPTLAAPPSLALPAIERRELANGLKIVVVQQHELPVADFILVVGTGGEGDPRGKPGVASLTAALLQEGAGQRSALAIADQEAYLGANLGTYSGWDASQLSLHTPTAQLDSALALFADIALRPSFPDRELERVRAERVTALLQLRDRAPAIADRAYASLLYGGEHPYGRPLSGTETSVKGITGADVRRFYDTFYRPNNATLIVVGDVTPDDVERRVGALFGGWKRGTVPSVELREPARPERTTIYLIDKPGAPQSSFRIGSIGVSRSTDDYFAILVMNTILGGSFTSRLMQNLRETHGYTYGARSRFDMRRAAGPFTASAEVVAAKTDSALVEFLKELRTIRDAVPAAELTKAKRYIQLGLPQRFETTTDIAAQLVPIVLYGLPFDYFNGYVQRVEAVTPADIQRVAAKYIDPAKLAIVVVGDRKSIEAGLKAANAGEISVRDFSGQPIKP